STNNVWETLRSASRASAPLEYDRQFDRFAGLVMLDQSIDAHARKIRSLYIVVFKRLPILPGRFLSYSNAADDDRLFLFRHTCVTDRYTCYHATQHPFYSPEKKQATFRIKELSFWVIKRLPECM